MLQRLYFALWSLYYVTNVELYHNETTLALQSFVVLQVGSTRKSVAMAYGRRCEVNLSVLEKLVCIALYSIKMTVIFIALSIAFI